MSEPETNATIPRHKVVAFNVGPVWVDLADAHDAAEDYMVDLNVAGLQAFLTPDRLDGNGAAVYVGKVPPELPVPMPDGAILINYNWADYYPPPAVMKAEIANRRKARKAKGSKR